MDKSVDSLYRLVYVDIVTQFGAGDVIEDGDREACAEQIVEDLEKAGYRKIVSLRDFVVTAGELSTMREKAYNDARKETAKEILQAVWNEGGTVSGILKLAKEYGVEVDE